jgi:hypothetical protein
MGDGAVAHVDTIKEHIIMSDEDVVVIHMSALNKHYPVICTA